MLKIEGGGMERIKVTPNVHSWTFSWFALTGQQRKCVVALVRVRACVCVVGAVRAALSHICGGLQECSLPLKSLLSVLNKYQVQNEGNVASQGSIQPCFIKGSRFLILLPLLLWGVWRGHIHTDEVSWTRGWSSKRHSPSVKTQTSLTGWWNHNEAEVCGWNARGFFFLCFSLFLPANFMCLIFPLDKCVYSLKERGSHQI